jgi:hypothetical protein
MFSSEAVSQLHVLRQVAPSTTLSLPAPIPCRQCLFRVHPSRVARCINNWATASRNAPSRRKMRLYRRSKSYAGRVETMHQSRVIVREPGPDHALVGSRLQYLGGYGMPLRVRPWGSATIKPGRCRAQHQPQRAASLSPHSFKHPVY